MGKKQYDIFISYSRKDIDKVLPIVKEIESKGISVWFDINGIESGEEFVTKIATAIDNSDSILFMYTENSVNGQWTQKEVMYAKEQKKTVIPILLNGSMPDKGWFKFLYGTINCIDITNSLQKEKLYKELNNKYGEKTSLSIKEAKDISTEQKVLEKHKEVEIQLNFFQSHKKSCLLTISVLVVFFVILIPSAIFINEDNNRHIEKNICTQKPSSPNPDGSIIEKTADSIHKSGDQEQKNKKKDTTKAPTKIPDTLTPIHTQKEDTESNRKLYEQATRENDTSIMQRLADKGYSNAYAKLAQMYLSRNDYDNAAYWAHKAWQANINREKAQEVIEYLDQIDYYIGSDYTKPF